MQSIVTFISDGSQNSHSSVNRGKLVPYRHTQTHDEAPSSNNDLGYKKDFIKTIRDAAVLSDASYQKPGSIKAYIEAHGHHHNIREFIQTQDSTEDGLSYMLAKSAPGTLYVAIRGTVNLDDWKKINFQLGFDVKIEGRSGRVHKGFWKHANKLPLSYLQDHANNGTQVVFTGHSLGGATAAVAAMILMGRVHNKERVQCVTFGAPLFADKSIQQELHIRDEEKHFHHFVAEKDIVPRAMNAPALAKQVVKTLFSKGVDAFQDITLGTVPYVPIGQFKVFGEKDYDLKEAKQFMRTTVPLTDQQTYVEGRQQHSIGYYLAEMKKYWAGLSCKGCHNISKSTRQGMQLNRCSYKGSFKDIDTIPTLFSDHCKVGIIDSMHGAKTLRVQIFGSNLAFIETLESRDLRICSDQTDASVTIIGITKLHHTSNMMMYDIQVSRKIVINRSHKPSLTLSFRSRFKNLTTDSLDDLPIHKSYFPSRKERIKHEDITETLIQIRHILIAEIGHKLSSQENTSSSKSREEVVEEMIKPHKQHLEDLDNWLNSAIDDHLGTNQKNLLKAVIASVENTTITTKQTFEIICDTVHALNKNDKNKIKLCCSKLHFGERTLSEQEKKRDFFESIPSLPRCFFKNIVIGGLEDQNDEVSLHQSQLIKMEIMLAVVFGFVVNKLFKNCEYWGKMKSCAKIASAGVGLVIGGAMISPALPITLLPVFLDAVVVSGFFTSLGGVVSIPIVALLAYFKDQSFQTTSCFENFMIGLVEKVVTIDDSQDLYLKEKKIGQLDLTDYEANQKILLSFVQSYCSKATKLRDTVVNKCSFNIGFVGQPGAGKSTTTSKNRAGIFENAPAFSEKTVVPRHFRCSDNVNCIDFPGMYGTDEFQGADPNVFRRALHTLDAVVIFVKAYDRSYQGVQNFVEMINKVPIYVCMTHADGAINERMIEIEQRENDESDEDNDCDEESGSDDKEDEHRYKKAFQDLNRWHSDFCIHHKVNHLDAHFVIPSKFLLKRARKENKWLKNDVEGIGHLVDWLFEKAKQCSGVDMNPALQRKFRKY